MKDTIRVLLVEPQKHPRLVEVEHTLENLQGLVGDWIAASYPWDDPVGLVYGDNSKFRGDTEPNRMLEDYDVLVGPFFLCGLGCVHIVTIRCDMEEFEKEVTLAIGKRRAQTLIPVVLSG